MAQIGKPLDPWQSLMTIDSFGQRADGRWAAREIVGLLPRQNGKGGFTEAEELGGLFLLKEKMILHSAHLFPTAMQAFQRLIDLIEGSDWLTKRVNQIRRSKGAEGIQLTRAMGGGELNFVARTVGGARGFTGSRLIFDEAYALTAAQFAAQTPTLATIPNHQITYTSTPPDEDTGPMPEDAMLPSVRKRGMAGDPRMAYFEWSPPRGADEEDVDVWYDCNPALGIRIEEEFLADQLRAFRAAGKSGKFSTEHLGLWPATADEQWQVIGETEWTAAGDSESKAVGAVAIGVSMTADRSKTAIGICGRRADGRRHIQLIEQGAGSGWVVASVKRAIAERKICIVVIGAGDPARSLLPDFADAKIEVLTPGTAEVAAECGAVFDGLAGVDLAGRDISHPKQGPLTAAVAAAVKKKVGAAWLWERLDISMDVSPLYAVTNASYGFRMRPPSNYNALNNIW